MSDSRVTRWLISNNPSSSNKALLRKKATTLAVASGKGGVGKTSLTVNLGTMLRDQGHKVLLLDCDFNLSNTAVKLGLPLENFFLEYIQGQRGLDDIIYKDGDLHLIPACNGNLELVSSIKSIEKIIIDIINEKEREYDFILLDCAAGISESVLTLCAYCDNRIIVVAPDPSSLTDSYSLVKVLNKKYGVNENHLVLNKVANQKQYSKLVRTLTSTVDHFLSCRLQVMGGVSALKPEADTFDREMLIFSDDKIKTQFLKLTKKITEMVDDESPFDKICGIQQANLKGHEQDVLTQPM